MLVTTGLNQLICADPTMAHAILNGRREFVQPDIVCKVMGFLGSNILTSNGESWSRQRRVVAPVLNERISPEVYKATAKQAESFVNNILSSPSTSTPSMTTATATTSTTIQGLRTIAINVLTKIAYGDNKPFAITPLPGDPSAPMSYVDAISLCTELLDLAAFIPIRILRLPFMSNVVQTLGAALHRLPGLTVDMLDRERRRLAEVSSLNSPSDELLTTATVGKTDTIMSMLVRLSDQEKSRAVPAEKSATATAGNSNPKSYLTEEEIAGNLFIFTAAGFDTTANTLAYAVTLLAAYPEWQAWIQAELDVVLGPPTPSTSSSPEQEGRELPDYSVVFPKLTRCLAVMFETLRLFPPLTHLMRSNITTQTLPSQIPTSTTLQSSSTSTSTLPSSTTTSSYTFPPCTVYINTVALHTSPKTWGPDALSFTPTRWLTSPQPSPSSSSPQPPHIQPPRGTFLPWSSGPRTCPGQKMAQVEFVTVLATLFHKCTVEPVPEVDESGNTQAKTTPEVAAAQARQRLLDLTQDSQPRLTLQMNRPKDVRLRWTRR
ncbi:cytochrome P450 [Colletotrichum lupini]|nr:cytochrome P450 [Colletotrichum lupini]